MTVKDSLYGQTKTYTNKAYQVDLEMAMRPKEVTNTLVSPELKKQNLNKDKVDNQWEAHACGNSKLLYSFMGFGPIQRH